MSDIWKKGLVTEERFLTEFVAAYIESRPLEGRGQKWHPEDIVANFGIAVDYFARGWGAAMDHMQRASNERE